MQSCIRFILIIVLSFHSLAQARGPNDLDALISKVRAQGNIPGIVAIAFNEEGVDLSVQGIRRIGASSPVRLEDRMHIGSNIKSMTATTLAILVERRRLRFESTLAELFPELPMHADYRNVTVEQLLTHRGGIAPLLDLQEIAQLPPFSGNALQQRAAFVRWALAQPPASAIGEFQYSNGGYALAGAIIDRVYPSGFEFALQNLLLRPLGVNAMFGWPAANNPRQPWGHYELDGALISTDPNDPAFVFPLWLRSAGDLSISLMDYTRYLLLHVEAACGRTHLLSAASFERLHAIPTEGEAYSMGWSEVIDADGRQLSWHSGSAGNFYTTVAYDHRCERGIAILGNSGSEAAGIATESAVFEWVE